MNHDALLIGGMRFKKINASTHRMVGIAKLFKPVSRNVFLYGVGEDKEEGFYEDFQYKTAVYPKTTKEWIHFYVSAKKYIDLIKSNKQIKYVVVSGAVPSIPTIKIAKYCKKHNIRFIFDIGEWYTNSYKFIKRVIKGFDTFLKMHNICKNYKNYIVASSFLEKHCTSRGSKKNILVIPAIVSNILPNIKKEKDYHDVIKLSFIGYLEKNNLKENLSPLISAIEEFNLSHSLKFRLSVVGSEGENSESVIYYGEQPYKESIKHLVESNFSVIPRSKTRKNESGFPTKLSESFLYRIPVISTDTSDIKHYIIDGKNGYLISSNTKQCFLDCFKKIENEIKINGNYFNAFAENVVKYNKLKIQYFEDSFINFFNTL